MKGVFISCSGLDDVQTNDITRSLPSGLVQIYTHSFVDGKTLLGEMERIVRQCSAFVFLASKNSLDSVWCNHEIELAEIEAIRRNLPVFVIGLTPNLSLDDLPPWMRNFWISKSGSRLSITKRRIQDVVEQFVIEPILAGHRSRVDRLEREYLEHVSLYSSAPNCFMISGVDSIGRHTSARLFIEARIGNRRFSNGPLIKLQDPASIEDLYIQLAEDLHGSLGLEYKLELESFRSLSFDEKVSSVVKTIFNICSDDETVYIECRSGAFDENGYLIDWAKALIWECSTHSRIRLFLISTRQPRRPDIAGIANLMHFHVSSLTADEIKGLVRDTTLRVSGRAMTPSTQALSAIGGHPVLAKHYASAAMSLGEALEEEAAQQIIMHQRTLFSDFLSYESLNETQKDILSVLSWIPHAGADLLDELLSSIPLINYKPDLAELHLGSLIEYNSGRYSISGPVRHIFRQLYGDGSKEIAAKVARILNSKIADGKLITQEIIDLTTYVIILFAGDLPRDVRELLSASTLLRSARALYQRGRERAGPAEYEKVVELCAAALTLTSEISLLRDISAVQARSLLRLRQYEQADKIIANLEQNGGRLALNLRAQYHRFKGEFRQAVPLYRTLIDSGNTDESVLHEYCLCLRKIGDIDEVRRIVDRYDDKVKRSVYLLRMRVSLELGSGKFRAAETTISLIKNLYDPTETAAEKEAVLIARETQDYPRSMILITSAIERVDEAGGGIIADLHSTRCLIYCKMRMVREARADMNIVRAKHRDGEFVARRLAVHVLLAEKRYKDALAAFDQLPDKTRLDSALHLEILNNYLSYDQILIVDRQRLETKRSSVIAGSRSITTEYDF